MSSTCFEPDGSSQEDSCIYSYGMVRFTCIGIGSPVGRRVFSILLLTRLLITVHIKLLYHNCIYSRLPGYEPSGSIQVEDIKKN